MSEYTVEVDNALFEVLSVFSQVAEEVGASWFVIGATACVINVKNNIK